MDTSSQRIIIKRNGDRFGPYTVDETRRYLTEGRILHGDTATIEGSEKWLSVGTILEGQPEPFTPEVDAKIEPLPAIAPPPVLKSGLPDSEPPPLPLPSEGWYYSDNGKRTGPVSEDQIWKLISTQAINEHTLVWRSGMPNWTAAYQTDIIRSFFGSKPPPLPGEGVDNTIVWVLAVAPIVIGIIEALIASAVGVYHGFWVVGYIVNTLLCYQDSQKLKNAGYDTKGMSNWIVLVPVYLFVRASRLKQNNAYAIVWLVTFFISLFM